MCNFSSAINMISLFSLQYKINKRYIMWYRNIRILLQFAEETETTPKLGGTGEIILRVLVCYQTKLLLILQDLNNIIYDLCLCIDNI